LQVRSRQPKKYSLSKASAGRFPNPYFLRFPPLRAFHFYPWQKEKIPKIKFQIPINIYALGVLVCASTESTNKKHNLHQPET